MVCFRSTSTASTPPGGTPCTSLPSLPAGPHLTDSATSKGRLASLSGALIMAATADEEREAAMANYRRKLLTHRVGGHATTPPPHPQKPWGRRALCGAAPGFPRHRLFQRVVLAVALSNLWRQHRVQQFPEAAWRPAVRRWEFARDVACVLTHRSCTIMHDHADAGSDLRPVHERRSDLRPVRRNPNDRASCSGACQAFSGSNLATVSLRPLCSSIPQSWIVQLCVGSQRR